MKSKSLKTSRRKFLKSATALGSGSIILTSLPSGMYAQITKPDDPRLFTEMIDYPGVSLPMIAYQARPVENKNFPAVIVIHENRGLQPHIKDVARRIALKGFVALAPDALSPYGGTPDNQEEAMKMMQKLDYNDTIKNFVAAVKYIKSDPMTTGKVGCTGFCWGGGMTNQVAVNAPDLNAAVPFYGMQPKAEDVARIKCPMLLQYAENDERIDRGIPDFEKELKQANVEYQVFIYPGTVHGFFNDTNPERYNKEAAELAWARTIKFFEEKLE